MITWKKWGLLVLLVSSFLLNSCAGIHHDLQSGKQKSLITEFEKKTFEKLSGNEFTALCRAYYRSRKYNKFFSCVRKFKIKFSDRQYSWVFNGFNDSIDITGSNPYIEEDLALAYFEIQKYDLAYKHAKNTIQLLHELVSTQPHSFLSFGFPKLYLYRNSILPLKLMGIISLERGNRKEALSAIAELDKIEQLDSSDFSIGSAVVWMARNNGLGSH